MRYAGLERVGELVVHPVRPSPMAQMLIEHTHLPFANQRGNNRTLRSDLSIRLSRKGRHSVN